MRCALSTCARTGVAFILLACLACGGAPAPNPDNKPTHPVQGQVLLDDRPVKNVTVTFHLQGGDAKAPRAYGRTDADGKFTLSTYQPGDGAPTGSYLVTLLPDADEAGPSVAASYGHPSTSGLTFEVKEGANNVPPLRVRRGR